MPRLISSFTRILKFILFSWLTLIGLWIFLPSPPITSEINSGVYYQYIQRTLRARRILHTIYPWDESFDVSSVTILPANDLYPGSPPQRARVSGLSSDCTHLIVDWQLSRDGEDAVILGMGRDVRHRLYLTDAALKVLSADADKQNPDLILLREEDGKDELVYVSDQVRVQVDAGGADHIINLPWFWLPDAAMFHNQMHGFTYEIDLRVVARKLLAERKTVVEVWKSAPVTEWLRLREKERLQNMGYSAIDGPDDDGVDGKYVKNIFRSESHYSSGLLATVSNVDNRHHSTSGVEVRIRNAQLSSRTYWIRSIILVPLAPSLIVTFFLLIYLMESLSVLICYETLALVVTYCVAVLICWMVYNLCRRNFTTTNADEKSKGGRKDKEMTFLQWSSKRGRGDYRGKRIVIWGPTGPVYEDVIDK
ncbi:hypothetical protein TSTA_059020 [Talaromyces stipitatus ATCC 10500]|uniref:Uncharacterized protein n=1 Tax=Talaromyces stipitatus (strain ATCC 10500 / CBS 375.48 / QM 6759 / NRRL 1006) TaxID=441959 RepID=B8MRX9_TALSN|nr:uncharacterized protein TSTA_059020 [Talaromyces stipitatus ATCC 10500]EED13415.1 hypothetical protein TSTA_059020 [Talaromyces stipitatus ATCC 10500]